MQTGSLKEAGVSAGGTVFVDTPAFSWLFRYVNKFGGELVY